MRMPSLAYVREWILRNAGMLASIDLHPDMFQPDVSIQGGVLILERKPKELIDVETPANKIKDYPSSWPLPIMSPTISAGQNLGSG